MTEYGGSAGGNTRGVRTLDDRIQSGVPATQYREGVIENDLVENALVVYDGNLPGRRFVNGQEVLPDGTEAELLVPGEDEHGAFVETRGERYYESDLELIRDGTGRDTVLQSDEAVPDLIQSVGHYKPTDADQFAAVIWLGKIAVIAQDLELDEERTETLARRLLDTYSEIRAAAEERDRLEAKAAKAELREEWGHDYEKNINAIEANLKNQGLFPDGFGEEIVAARRADGTRLINHPTVPRFLAGLEVSGDDADASEYEELTRLMNTDISEFMGGRWKGSNQTPSDRMLEIERQRTA
jgi:hypothetical protein